jgi:uncharacterized protein
VSISRSLSTPTERQAALNVGVVDSVAPDRIVARLELEAPQTTALNTGSPISFPRLNGFVVVPNESGALVGIVTWLGVEASEYPKRPGLKDFGLVDLPFPLRKMNIVPVGTLERTTDDGQPTFRLQRGVVTFPSVGDAVALPSSEQLTALTKGRPNDRRVHVGRMLLGNDAEVRVDPDKLFGRHLAVLGNTGSGKSCSVAGLIRWSLQAATASRKDLAKGGAPRSRFVVLDPNGEYRSALRDLAGFKLFQVPPVETNDARELQVPAWLLNSREWASITAASARIQRPMLVYALRHLRTGSDPELGIEQRLARLARAHVVRLESLKTQPLSYTGFPRDKSFGQSLLAFREGLERYAATGVGGDELRSVIDTIDGIVDRRRERGQYWTAFAESDLDDLIVELEHLVTSLPDSAEIPLGNEDLPVPFEVDLLPEELDVIASLGEFEDSARYVGGLKLRVRSLLSDERMRPILQPDDTPQFDAWLEAFLGDGSDGSIAVIDLSLVPSDVVEVVVAVMGRLIFEALQRHRRQTGQALPTALVLEEAHTFARHQPGDEEYITPGQMCVRTFERIAREGRKFGLGLVLSSQRPSELSATILAQCNSFLLHRLVNDRDQDLVGRLVPDNLSGLLADLPSLPSRHALLLGWAAELPMLLEVRELAEEHRPQSSDPDFWAVWTGERDPAVDWPGIASRWAGQA